MRNFSSRLAALEKRLKANAPTYQQFWDNLTEAEHAEWREHLMGIFSQKLRKPLSFEHRIPAMSPEHAREVEALRANLLASIQRRIDSESVVL